MLRLYILFILIIFTHTSYSQSVNIVVTMNNQSAPYSYIKVNNTIIGMCDKDGKYAIDIDKETLRNGDKISAEFATIKSEDFLFETNIKSITLIIDDILMPDILVKGDKVKTLDNYLNLIKNSETRKYVNRYTFNFKIKHNNTKKTTTTYKEGKLDVVAKRGTNSALAFDDLKSGFVLGDTTMEHLSSLHLLVGYYNFKKILNIQYLKRYNKQKEVLIQDKGASDSKHTFLFISKNDQTHQVVIIDKKTGLVHSYNESYRANKHHYNFYIKPKYDIDNKTIIGMDSMKFSNVIGVDSIQIEGDIYDVKLSEITFKQSQKLIKN